MESQIFSLVVLGEKVLRTTVLLSIAVVLKVDSRDSVGSLEYKLTHTIL